MNLQQAFEAAWVKTSTNNLDRDAAMNWFYEGVAAQKQMQPPIRMADATKFAAQRNANKEGTREPLVSPFTNFFLTLVRRYGEFTGVQLHPTTADVEAGSAAVMRMQADGAVLDSWVITNFCKNRVSRYITYDGFAELQALMAELKRRSSQEVATQQAA